MKNFFGKFKEKNMDGKAFAAAVCVCLLIVGGIGIYSYKKAEDQLNDALISSNKSSADLNSADDDTKQANAEQTQIAKKETVTTVTEAPADEEKTEEESTQLVYEAAAETYTALVRPLNGEVLNEFSDGELVKSATLNVWKTHDGVDIAGELGEKVKSMTSGTVTEVYEDSSLGACVVIDHGNGCEGYYCNLSTDIPVTEGEKVSAGTIIGTVGDTAESEIKEAPHLHFALKKNGEWIDPIAFISGEGS
jgi:murein DD-endopeptidase MepM/ murein hydrolase activator NlpD